MLRLGLSLCLLLFSLSALVPKSFSRTWHIKVDGSGDAPTIQAAIDSAALFDTVLVGPGTYSWSNQGTGDSYGMIRVMEGTPAMTIVSETGPGATILDAEFQNRILFVQGDNPGPGELTLDGFTFTRGTTTQANNLVGGAITAHLSSPTVRNCVFRSNYAEKGGAVWFGGVGSPLFANCVFEGNTARTGGAVYAVNTPYTVRLSGCVIRGNEASSTAGGIFGYNVPLVVENCEVSGNFSATDGGGMTLINCYASTVSRSTFYGNGATSGGGIALLGTVILTVEGTIIAASESGGAAALGPNTTMALSCSDLFGNTGGDWTGRIAGQLGIDGNISVDPLFCGGPALDFTLKAASPCAPGNHPDGAPCGLIGALGVGCGGVPVEVRSWGAIKSMYGD